MKFIIRKIIARKKMRLEVSNIFWKSVLVGMLGEKIIQGRSFHLQRNIN
ncbi:hypothetical protein [Ferruginibacter sp.]|nr:hypothetical protein [Ferruginibacter sp.]